MRKSFSPKRRISTFMQASTYLSDSAWEIGRFRLVPTWTVSFTKTQ
jgi:hypothetical protein